MASLPVLKDLNLADCDIESVEIFEIEEAVSKHAHLQTLDLSENPIEPFSQIAPFLKRCRSLKKFKFRDNYVDNKGLLLLGLVALESQIMQFDLSDCQVLDTKGEIENELPLIIEPQLLCRFKV